MIRVTGEEPDKTACQSRLSPHSPTPVPGDTCGLPLPLFGLLAFRLLAFLDQLPLFLAAFVTYLLIKLVAVRLGGFSPPL
jgi:hypothetical protein